MERGTEDMTDLIFKMPVFNCPKHGHTTHVIQSTIPDYLGNWCQKCWLDTLGAPLKEVEPVKQDIGIIRSEGDVWREQQAKAKRCDGPSEDMVKRSVERMKIIRNGDVDEIKNIIIMEE
jgi:hypothetical protein